MITIQVWVGLDLDGLVGLDWFRGLRSVSGDQFVCWGYGKVLLRINPFTCKPVEVAALKESKTVDILPVLLYARSVSYRVKFRVEFLLGRILL